MKMKFTTAMIISFSVVTSQVSYAQLRQINNTDTTIVTDEFNRAVTATTTTTTTSTLPNQPTIQDLAKATERSNQRGAKIAQTLTAICAAGAAASCYSGNKKWCRYWVAGLVATYIMARQMSRARGKSNLAYQAVTVEDPDLNIKTPPPVNPDEENFNVNARLDGADALPDMKKAKAAIDRLKKEGWKIDEKKGDITTPKGEKLNAKMMQSPKSMAAAGVPASFIKEFSNLSKIAAQKVEEKAKTADSGEGLYGDDLGGGGGRRPSVAGSADGGGALYGSPYGAGPKMGLDRDPAQVAGMTKDYNGEKIGVSADSLFHMIDRRYELHQKKGSFLAP